MDKKEILEFIKSNPMGNLATVEGNKPHVRGMETYRADENGLIFYTSKTKDVSKQLSANPEVEVCYVAQGTQVRVSGRVELVKDTDLMKEIVEARPFLKPMVEQQGYDFMAVYRLKNGKVTTWSMQDMAAPKTFIDL
jgi:pyridoxamine 5'-phosphate oxidase